MPDQQMLSDRDRRDIQGLVLFGTTCPHLRYHFLSVNEAVAGRRFVHGLIEHGSRLAHRPAEIESVDLAGLALELAAWGTTPDRLSFADPPPARAWRQGLELLAMLGATDPDGRLTDRAWSQVRFAYGTDVRDFSDASPQFVAATGGNNWPRNLLLAALACALVETWWAGRIGRRRV